MELGILSTSTRRAKKNKPKPLRAGYSLERSASQASTPMSQDRTHMQLWSDYEGKTLAGTFPIEALLLTEGRNASFATHDREGRPAVLRLTEALNDQQELRARYDAIREIGQSHLVSIEDYGDVEMEGIPLIYLVMEPTQESLADILRERPLSIEETSEVAASLVAALQALHSHGLVHGQVVPESVLAAGQIIKLRSDCVRLAPAGEDGLRAMARDMFGLADVLNRSLTQQPLVDGSDASALPEPYASIVRNVVRGSWGLDAVAAAIADEVRRFAPPPSAPETDSAASAESLYADETTAAAGMIVPAIAASSVDIVEPMGMTIPAEREALVMYGARVEPVRRPQAPAFQVLKPAKESWGPAAPAFQPRLQKDRVVMVWTGVAAVLFAAVLLAWHSTHASQPSSAADSAAAAPLTATAAPENSAAAPVGSVAAPARSTPAPTRFESSESAPVTDGVAPGSAAQPAAATLHGEAAGVADAASLADPAPSLSEPAEHRRPHALLHGEVWRVVAFTYNVASQAREKADAIEKSHAELHPEVFSPSGHAPYLVTVGGALSEQEAAQLRERARSEGLARDVYMQNYTH